VLDRDSFKRHSATEYASVHFRRRSIRKFSFIHSNTTMWLVANVLSKNFSNGKFSNIFSRL